MKIAKDARFHARWEHLQQTLGIVLDYAHSDLEPINFRLACDHALENLKELRDVAEPVPVKHKKRVKNG